MSNIPTLSKREYDARLFSVNVSGKLREGDNVTNFVSIVSKILSKTIDSPDDVTINIYSVPITNNNTLNFTCSGGTTGTSYLLALRYASTTELQLESLVQIDVY